MTARLFCAAISFSLLAACANGSPSQPAPASDFGVQNVPGGAQVTSSNRNYRMSGSRAGMR